MLRFDLIHYTNLFIIIIIIIIIIITTTTTIIIIVFLTPVLNSLGMEKITLCNAMYNIGLIIISICCGFVIQLVSRVVLQ